MNYFSRKTRLLLFIFIDIFLSLFSSYLAILIRSNDFVKINLSSQYLIYLYLCPIILYLSISILRGNYKNINKYNNTSDYFDIGFNILFYAFIYVSILIYFQPSSIPRSIAIIQPILFFNLIVIFRYLLAKSYKKINENKLSGKNVFIYGAGEAGAKLFSILENDNDFNIKGFIDDDKELIGRRISSLKIYGKDQIETLAFKKKIDIVILALPSIDIKEIREIINYLEKLSIKVISVPEYKDILSGKVSINALRTLKIEELIDRNPPISQKYISRFKGKKILITGAGGSIGSELCRQLIRSEPKLIILIDNSEFNLYAIEDQLNDINIEIGSSTPTQVEALLVSIVQEEDINIIFSKFKPEVVFHAAAYKHVPMLEKNILASVKNNFFGTKVVVDASFNSSVKEFLLVSTDKAVRPTNIMGATKRLAEIYVQSFAHKNMGTTFSIVRFGNVLNSSGSILPRFLKQISTGGPVTVTHTDVTRYFMTIPEAAGLLIESISLAKHCEVFLLDMGEPVRIFDLAKKVINLSGLKVKSKELPHGDIEIKIIGLRPGEKLFEELLLENNSTKTINKKIYKSSESFIKYEVFEKYIEDILIYFNKKDEFNLLNIIKKCLPEFKHNKQNK